MDTKKLEELARRIVGRPVQVQVGAGSWTDGSVISVTDPAVQFPKLPAKARDAMSAFLTAHEASHIVYFDRVARKLGRPSISAEEFYREFADPAAPGRESIDYVRFVLNVVEDRLVDEHAARHVGEVARAATNRFFVWNRGGGRRPSMAELEASGSAGKCAAFVEAVFQLENYNELVEAFYSVALESAAKEATAAIVSYGQGSLSRTQALTQVLAALRKYCPPPWRLPAAYQPPRGEGAGNGGDPAANPSSGSPGKGSGGKPNPGQGKPGEGEGSGQGSGDGAGEGQGEGKGSGEGSGEGSGSGDASGKSSGEGKPGDGSPSDGKGEGQSDSADGDGDGADASEGSEADASSDSDSGDGEGEGEADAEESEGDDDPEPGSESAGGGNGSPSESNSRGAETGGEAGSPRPVTGLPERRFEDNNLEALLRMLERVLAERAKKTGRGMPRFRTWSPGDQISSPDEICAYQEDEAFGVDPLKRRCVRRRDREEHLLAVFIDSSGSVSDQLFAMLYRVIGELAEKIGQMPGTKLGVGQFSGGASWVLVPTDDATAIRDFSEEKPKRLYSGGTTVGEIYGLLPDDFAGYESADLIVLTDGYVEDGKVLATSLETAHEELGCEIKLHGVVFRGKGSLKQFKAAKDELPEFVRTWNLGGEE